MVITLKVEIAQAVLYLDGIYLSRKLCVLICCNQSHVLGGGCMLL